MRKVQKTVWVTDDALEFDTEGAAKRHEVGLEITLLLSRLPIDWTYATDPREVSRALLKDWAITSQLIDALTKDFEPEVE
jgi:hypothetical protein